jgi:hypothetical protein
MLAQIVLTNPIEAVHLPAVIAVLVQEGVFEEHGASVSLTARLSPAAAAERPQGTEEKVVLPEWCSTELDSADTQVYRISSLLLQKALLELLLSDEKQTKKFAERLQELPTENYSHLRPSVVAALMRQK